MDDGSEYSRVNGRCPVSTERESRVWYGTEDSNCFLNL